MKPCRRKYHIQPLHKGYRLWIKTIFHRAYIIDVYIWSLGLFPFGVCSWWCIGSFLVSIIFLYRKTALWHILSYYLWEFFLGLYQFRQRTTSIGATAPHGRGGFIGKVNGSCLGYPFFYCLQTTLRKECVLWTLFLLGTLHCPPLKLYNVHHLYLAVFSIPFLFCLLLTFMLHLLNRIWLVQPYLWTFCNLKSISLIAKNVFGSCPLTALILSYPQKNFSSNY